jgi:outer membrane murein-binding lipoprotein Lpp
MSKDDRMRGLRTIVAAALMTPLLAGCSDGHAILGRDPFTAYCNVVADKQQELSEILGVGGPDALLNALPVFRDLEDAAPHDIRDDWKIVVTGLTALEDALDDAGVDPATYDRDDPPAGVSEAEKDRIDAAAQELTAPDSTTAFAAVEQQARDVCQTPLHL